MPSASRAPLGLNDLPSASQALSDLEALPSATQALLGLNYVPSAILQTLFGGRRRYGALTPDIDVGAGHAMTVSDTALISLKAVAANGGTPAMSHWLDFEPFLCVTWRCLFSTCLVSDWRPYLSQRNGLCRR